MTDNSEMELCDTTIRSWVAYDAFEYSSFASYIKDMKRRETWAGNLELRAMAEFKNLTILVYRESDGNYALKTTIYPNNTNKETRIVRLHHQGEKHYEVIHLTRRGQYKHSGPIVLACSASEDPKVDPEYYDSDPDSDPEDELERIKLKVMLKHEFEQETYDDVILAAITETFNLLTLQLKSPINLLREQYGDKAVDQAISDELQQMVEMKVWKYIKPNKCKETVYDEGKTPLPMQMLIKEKFDAAGILIKLKARLVVLGNLQTNDVYVDVSAPTASMHSVYFIIMLAAKRGIKLRTSDIKGAFLNALMREKEFVRIDSKMTKLIIERDPAMIEFVASNGTMVAELLKCLYGLKQSPLRWFETMEELLLELGFVQSIHDPCFFYKIIKLANNHLIRNYLVLYVDDMLIAFQSDAEYKNLIDKMVERFGDVSTVESNKLSFLGLNITSTIPKGSKIAETITVDQIGYIEKLLNSITDFDLSKATFPCCRDFKINDERFLTPRIQANPALAKTMKSLTMKIMFAATRTRRDVLFLTSFLASINCPTLADIESAKHLIAYMYNTREKKQIFYKSDGKIELIMFGDASYKAFRDGTGQNCQIVYADKESAPIRFSSKRAHRITTSASESEATAQVDLTKMGEVYHTRLLEIQESTPIPLAYCDNLVTVNQSKERHLNTSGKSQFYAHLLHFLNQRVRESDVTTKWIISEEMNADVGTKNLFGAPFFKLADRTFSRREEE